MASRCRDRNGKEISRHFQRKIDAQHWLDSVTTAVATGAVRRPRSFAAHRRELSQKWLDTKTNLKATTRRD